MMGFSVGGMVSVETTGRPLRFTPRFDLPGQQLIVAGYADAREREQQLADTFGSGSGIFGHTPAALVCAA
ncbi:hypothetical protein [Streptomyces sp. NBC_00063]|uniref:hypothetical protein n=1 Tax=Streptomyces sp. NBC_00063 TaxID=2975638 RepID=UPI002258C3BD|nr:hypothetical protein [Streptomyces sp. NBC_00063]MCX5441264.1 hypothetical protein [Streptomyces sp. NBC_00063]